MNPRIVTILTSLFLLLGLVLLPFSAMATPYQGLKRPSGRRCGDQTECNARDGLLRKHAVPGPLYRPVASVITAATWPMVTTAAESRQGKRDIRSYSFLLRAVSIERVLYVRRDRTNIGCPRRRNP